MTHLTMTKCERKRISGWIKKREGKLRQKAIRKVSDRQRLINSCKDLLRAILKIERGDRCELCGRTPHNLGLFHILPEGAYKRISLHRENLLLSCWFPCHYHWHRHRTDSPQGRRVQQRVIDLRGADYQERLMLLNHTAPRLTTFQISLVKIALERELEGLR